MIARKQCLLRGIAYACVVRSPRMGKARLREPANATAAFTLIELLIAMMVLALLVITVGNITMRSSALWAAGQAQTATSETARNALQLLRANASEALVNDVFPFYTLYDDGDPIEPYGTNSVLFFLANQRQPQGRHLSDPRGYVDWRELAFFVVPDSEGRGLLVRRMTYPSLPVERYIDERATEEDIDSLIMDYRRPADLENVDNEVIAENVYSFRVYCYDRDGSFLPFEFRTNRAPHTVEVLLTVLDDQTWNTVGALRMANDEAADDYARRHGRTFSTRLNFPRGASQ